MSLKSRFIELFESEGSGKLSHNKTWQNLGMSTITGVVIWYSYKGTLEEWMFWAYCLVVIFPNLVSKFITMKWGGVVQPDPAPTNDNSSDATLSSPKQP